MTKKLDVGNVLLADYVGPGQGNKVTLVNTYSGDVFVAAFPVMMSFGFYAETFVRPASPLMATISFLLDETQFLELHTMLQPNPAASGPELIVVPQFQSIATKESTLKIVMRVAGYHPAKLITKAIKLAPSDAISSGGSEPMPSPAQSEPASPA
ncbi:MAG TPA: hypothetical protein VMU93_14825 [Caulobacteraceae bacterium]|nr:hypothetical protein [Caulobacteraceae bacterium]